MQQKYLDIIVPFYNTSNHIFDLLHENIEALLAENQLPNFQIILVNDGSTKDNYIPYITLFNQKFSKNFVFIDVQNNQGKGGAIKEGMKHSTAPNAIFYDIDFPFGRKALYELFLSLQNTNTEICIARRDISYNQKLPWKRKIISQIVKKIILIFSKGKIKDSQAGLKGMKSSVIPLLLQTHCNSFLMDLEFLLKAQKKKKRIVEIIVTPNDNIEFTNFSNAILSKEIKNLLKIIFH